MARATEVDSKKIPTAIQMLDDGATKKDVCAFLGMAYNTTRLGVLIEEYLSGVERDKEQRKKRRGKPISQDEVVNIVEAYFADDSISDIANRFYRSEVMIKAVLEKHGALLRDNKADPLNPSFLPDNAVAESFEIGEHVWVAAYNCVGEIRAKCGEEGYRVYLLDRDNHRYTNQYTYDLGSLRHLQDLGVDTKRFGSFMGREEVVTLLNEAVRGANKNKVER
jgi:hypothetical protein